MTSPGTEAPRNFKYYDLVMAAFVTVLICSNFIGAAKQAVITLPLVGPIPFGAGVLFFPISYLFGDILTEVYGYARDRRVVWAGFGALAFASLMAWVVVNLPAASGSYMDTYQAQLEGVFGNAWRIAAASMLAFWAGSFVNSYLLAKIKIATAGKWLWLRTIGSTAGGELVDSSLFYVIAFFGIWETSRIVEIAIAQYLLKTGWEVVMTPVTYKLVGALKRAEGVDHFDRGTNFTPFSLKV
ncbi:queuosine precursor transporter [soil metagenome]